MRANRFDKEFIGEIQLRGKEHTTEVFSLEYKNQFIGRSVPSTPLSNRTQGTAVIVSPNIAFIT